MDTVAAAGKGFLLLAFAQVLCRKFGLPGPIEVSGYARRGMNTVCVTAGRLAANVFFGFRDACVTAMEFALRCFRYIYCGFVKEFVLACGEMLCEIRHWIIDPFVCFFAGFCDYVCSMRITWDGVFRLFSWVLLIGNPAVIMSAIIVIPAIVFFFLPHLFMAHKILAISVAFFR